MRVKLLSLGRVEEGPMSEVRRGHGRQLGHQLEEGGPRRRSVGPARPHQFVQPVRTVLRPFHDTALYHVSQHLLVR